MIYIPMEIFEFTFEEIAIKKGDIELLMGFEPGFSPYPFPEWIEKELQEAPALCSIKGGFKIYDNIKPDRINNSLHIDSQLFRPGKIALTQMKDATSAAVYACTAGHGITDVSRAKGKEGEEMVSYIRDLIGSVAVEKAAELIQEKIELIAREKKLNISTPFSPGYCEWSVAEQQKIFALLPENFCGIKLSSSSLMSPAKSVSGITGIGANCKKQYSQCHWCTDKDCIYGKIKRRKIA